MIKLLYKIEKRQYKSSPVQGVIITQIPLGNKALSAFDAFYGFYELYAFSWQQQMLNVLSAAGIFTLFDPLNSIKSGDKL